MMTKREDDLDVSWLRNLRYDSFDLNEPISESGKEDPRSPDRCSLSLLADHNIPKILPNPNGASSSSSWRNFNIDLNEPPSVSKREDPESPDRCSLPLLGDHSIPKNPPDPNCESSPSSDKGPLVRKRSSSGRLEKVKKPRPEEAALEVAEISPPPRPEWLVQVMRDRKEAEDAKLIFKKTLSESDVNTGQGRFLIPFKQLERNDFLTPEESRIIEQEEDEKGKKPGLRLILVNQRSEEKSLSLKRWVMKKKKDSPNGTLNYALTNGWNKFVKSNELKANDNINLWSFRSQGILCFALGTE